MVDVAWLRRAEMREMAEMTRERVFVPDMARVSALMSIGGTLPRLDTGGEVISNNENPFSSILKIGFSILNRGSYMIVYLIRSRETVREAVHYIPAGLGYRHYADPIKQDFNPDSVVFLCPNDDHDVPTYIDKFRDEVGSHIEVTERSVDTTDFGSIVTTAYDDIRSELTPDGAEHEGDDVYVNTSSHHWSLGAGYATAAAYLISEIEHDDDETLSDQITDPRDRITTYYTEPKRYRLDELLSATTQVATLQREFTRLANIAEERSEEIADNRKTVETMVNLLQQSGGGLRGILPLLEQNHPALKEDDAIREPLEDILVGIEKVTEGVEKLAQEETTDSLPPMNPATNLVDGLAALSDQADSDGENLAPLDLLQWVHGRLNDVHDLADTVTNKYEDLDKELDQSPEDLQQLVREIESQGLADGVRTFDEQHHSEYPGPVRFKLSPTRRAILYTLQKHGKAETHTELAIRVNQEALEAAPLMSKGIPSHSAITEFRTGAYDEKPDIWENCLELGTKDLITKNARRLKEKGFVSISQFGRGKEVKLTHAGHLYTASKTFDNNWCQNAFRDIYATIQEDISGFVDENPE
jgi:hypothetical protein